jgi:uridine kinase
MLNLQMPDGKTIQCPEGVTTLQLAATYAADAKFPIVAGIFNGEEVDIQKPLFGDGKVEFIAVNTEEGMRAFERSLLFLFIVATKKVCPQLKVETRNSLGSAVYICLHNGNPSAADLQKITKEMQKMIAAKEPFKYVKVSREEAVKYVSKDDMKDDRMGLLEMLSERTNFVVNILEDTYSYFFGPVLPSTELLGPFELIKYEDGVVINRPTVDSYPKVPKWSRTHRINDIYQEAEQWSAMIDCNTVAKLNKIVVDGQATKIIRIAEALQAKKIAAIADKVNNSHKDIKLILIAGPSSSGKTSFAQRLSDQLAVVGIKPLPISMDNYYLNRVDTPRKADGSYDFEALDAIDIPLFNDHLSRLLRGEKVKMPKYDFRSGTREYRGEEMAMDSKSVLVVEGIHGLNEKLTGSIPAANKLKIFVSALTPMSLDDYNRIHTTDMRLLRRMVRDSQFRSHDAAMTIELWPSVREGEEKYIFPFQEDANLFFNTSLIYELGVLRKYAEPLLEKIPTTEKAYTVARRLLGFLRLVQPISDETIPNNSILREFLGGSVFKDAL